MNTSSRQLFTKSSLLLSLQYIAIAGFTAGTLDGLAAVFIISHGNAASIFKFISSGIYGPAAFTGGSGMIFLGIAIHYFVAFFFSAFYFLLAGYINLMHKNIALNALAYGIFIYLFMNVLVMSLSNIQIPHRDAASVIKNTTVIILCVALPIAFFHRLYRKDR